MIETAPSESADCPASKRCSSCRTRKPLADFKGAHLTPAPASSLSRVAGLATCVQCRLKKRKFAEQATADKQQNLLTLVKENQSIREIVAQQAVQLRHWQSETHRLSILAAQQQVQLQKFMSNPAHQMGLKGSNAADYVHHPMSATVPFGSSKNLQPESPSMGLATPPAAQRGREGAVPMQPPRTAAAGAALLPLAQEPFSAVHCIALQQQMEDTGTTTMVNTSMVQTENDAAIQPKKLKLSEEAEIVLPNIAIPSGEGHPQEMCDETWDASCLQELGQEIWTEEFSDVLDSSWIQSSSEPSCGAGQGSGQYITIFPSEDGQSSASNNEKSVLLERYGTAAVEECCGMGSPATLDTAVETQKRLDLAADSLIPKTFFDILPFNTPFNRAFEDSRLERRWEGHHLYLRIIAVRICIYMLMESEMFTYQKLSGTTSGPAVHVFELSISSKYASLYTAVVGAIGIGVPFLCFNQHKQDLLWHIVRRCCYLAATGLRISNAFNLGPIFLDGSTPGSTILYAAIYFSVMPIIVKLILDPHWFWCIVLHHLVPLAIYLCTQFQVPDVYAQSEKYLCVLILSTSAVIMTIEYSRRVQFVNRLQANKLAREASRQSV